MREIKFRAWDGEKMDYDPVCCTDGPEITKLNSNIQSMCEEWHRPKYLALMQYTGLKDKTGKEIYEGDIVKSFWQHDGIIVQDYELIGEIIWDKEIAAFSLDCGNQIIKWLSSYEREELLELEIISNRYENPELLK